MSNPRSHHYRNYRYFGKDLTNFEKSHSRKTSKNITKNNNEAKYLNNYAEKLRQRFNLGRKNTRSKVGNLLTKHTEMKKVLL